MYPHLPLSAHSNNPDFTFNINNTTPIVPAKRKRANTSAPAQPTRPPPTSSISLPPTSYGQSQYAAFIHPAHPSSVGLASSSVTTAPTRPPGPRPQNSAPSSSGPGAGSDDIHCICGYSDDDGYTIACDDCGRWSHMVCFDISVGKDPDEWRCWECFPRPVNRERAHDRQAARVAAQMQGRLGPFIGSAEAEAIAAGSAQQRRRRRTTGIVAHNHPPPPLSAAHSGETGAEDEHVDIEDDWRMAYVPLTEDVIPHASTRTKLRLAAQNWRGVTALSPDDCEVEGSQNSRTKVVPVPNGKDDVAAAVRPPSYGLQTTEPIASEGLIAPFSSTIIPSAAYLADPLNGYAQLGMPKPHVHLVPPPLSVALDARMAGNEARFIRSGCRPNAVLRPVLCPSKQSGDGNEPGVLKFAIFALRDLKASEEVVLSWEWDDGAVVHQLPAIIEDGLRSGAGPSKMTSHHMKRLQLQMQSIVDSLKSSFVTCACGGAARDCAVQFMEAFVDGESPWLNGFHDTSRENSPRASRIQHTNAQVGPFRPSIYDQYQSSSGSGSPPLSHQNQRTPSSRLQTPPPPSTITTTTGANKHPTSLNSLHDLTRYVNAKARSPGLGPLIGAERGVRTRVVGGPDSGGLKGVQQVHGDRWDRFGELEVEVNELDGRRERKHGSEVPVVRVEQATPVRMRQKLDLKGKGRMTEPNGVGLGLGLEPHSWSVGAGASSSSSLSSPKETAEFTEETMPPKMRKRWMKEKSESLRNECRAVGREFAEPSAGSERREGASPGLIMAERSVNGMASDELGRAHEKIEIKQTDVRPTLAIEQQYSSMEVDSDTFQMLPPPPPETVSSTVSTQTMLPASSTTLPNSSALTPSTHPQSQTRRPTSLFSLLNEHPVSPIHTSNKHLATILNAVEEAVVVPSAKKVSVMPDMHPEDEAQLQPKQVPLVRIPTPVIEHAEDPQGLALVINGDAQMFEAAEIGTVEPEPDTESRDASPVIQENTPAPELIKEEAEIVALTAPSLPVEDDDDVPPSIRSASRMSTPTPVATSLPQMSNPTTPIRVLSPSPTAPGKEKTDRSPSGLFSQSPTPSPRVSVQPDAVVEIDSVASSSGWKLLTKDRGDESPRALFKEELMQAAVETQVQTDSDGSMNADSEDSMNANSEANVNVVISDEKAEEDVDIDTEASEKMIVDDSLRLNGSERLRSVSSLSSPESVHDKDEAVDENSKQNIVSSNVHAIIDDDGEVHDASSSPISIHERETHISPSPVPTPVFEVQIPSPPRLAVMPVSPAPPPFSNEPPSHSPLSKSKNSILTSPALDSCEEKHAILASVSPATQDSKYDHSPENASVVDNHAGSADQARLNTSSGLLRAPSPAVSVSSSVDARPTPPPFSIATSDNEHDSDQHHTQDQVQQTEATGASQGPSATLPSEPLKIRRSMADYKQRRRKQREEEAAKAALASPISPVSPLRQLSKLDKDDVNSTIDSVNADGAAVTANGSSHTQTEGHVEVTSLEEQAPAGLPEAQKLLVAPESSPMNTLSTNVTTLTFVEETLRPSTLPKREISEEPVDFSQSPEVESKRSGSLKAGDVPRTPPHAEIPQAYKRAASSLAASPTAEPGREPGRTPQLEEVGEVQDTPIPSKPRMDISPGKPPAVASTSAPSSATASTSLNSRFGSSGPAPPTQPRSFRDGRVISASPPPHYSREPLPPAPAAAGKSKLPGWPLRDRVGFPPKEATDRKSDAVPPITIRRASSYVPGPPQKSSSSAPSGSNAPLPTALSGQIRPAPPSGPRALRGPPLGLARTQPPLPPPRGPLADRVERDRSRDRDRERGDRERDRDRDRYSPPPRGRHAGRGRFWRGRR